MKWQQGRPALENMLTRKELERVPASREQADNLLTQASNHLTAAQAIVAIDAIGAYQLLYDAARKALVAVLENQGLRPTSRGGHIAVLEAVSAQLDPPLGGLSGPLTACADVGTRRSTRISIHLRSKPRMWPMTLRRSKRSSSSQLASWMR